MSGGTLFSSEYCPGGQYSRGDIIHSDNVCLYYLCVYTKRYTCDLCAVTTSELCSGIEASGLVDVVSEAWICSYMM